MKTVRNLALLLLAVAAGNSAKAQQVRKAQIGVPYTINSAAPAAGTGISYQWYRDGHAISGATSESYTIPASLAGGVNVEFKRGVTSTTCPGEVVFSNSTVITFYNLVINNVAWADVDDYQTFAARPDMRVKFYQWNSATAWAAQGGSVSGWITSIVDYGWTINPCPQGWRLPTMEEFQALLDGSTPIDGAWADANTRGNAVNGRFFGPNSASCTLPSNMVNCIFMQAGGNRGTSGVVTDYGNYGYYWSSTQYSNDGGYYLTINSTTCILNAYSKATGRHIRCVQ